MVNLKAQFEQFCTAEPDLYQALNRFRDWVNQNVINYEIFLEDEWFDDKTTLEYTFRSLDTFNTFVFAKDDYTNLRDPKGVWHLGQYVTTYWCVENPWEAVCQFISENEPPRYQPANLLKRD